MGTFENEIVEFEEIISTQLLAKKYLKEKKATHGQVLIAKKQTDGIGRLDRGWSSPLGGLWMTTIYNCDNPLEQFQGFSIRLGLEIIKELERVLPVVFQIKWPNDLIFDNKKVGGILIDTQMEGSNLKNIIIGIGININNKSDDMQSQITSLAISLSEICGKEISIDLVRKAVLMAQNRIFLQTDSKEIKDITDIWKTKSSGYQKEIRVVTDKETILGIEQGITEAGELIIKTTNNGFEYVSAGDIELMRIIEYKK